MSQVEIQLDDALPGIPEFLLQWVNTQPFAMNHNSAPFPRPPSPVRMFPRPDVNQNSNNNNNNNNFVPQSLPLPINPNSLSAPPVVEQPFLPPRVYNRSAAVAPPVAPQPRVSAPRQKILPNRPIYFPVGNAVNNNRNEEIILD